MFHIFYVGTTQITKLPYLGNSLVKQLLLLELEQTPNS